LKVVSDAQNREQNSPISIQKINKLLRWFCEDITAAAAAKITGFWTLKTRRKGICQKSKKVLKRGVNAGNTG
jgi:hypothetical protein